MPAKAALKELQKFNNTDELQKAASTPVNTFLSYKKLLETGSKLFSEAKLAELDGDEESAYVLYMRAFNVYHASRKAKDYVETRDKIHWKEMGGKNLPTALDKAESLFKNLQRRYELRRDLEEADRAEAVAIRERGDSLSTRTVQGSGTSASISKEANANLDADDGSNKKSSVRLVMDPNELYQELQKGQPSVLILDTRDASEYEKCHIKANACVNVPLKNLQDCYTASSFEQRLPLAARTLFRQRYVYPYIVLVDKNSEDVEDVFRSGKPLRILSAAIHEFDNRPTQRPPLLLAGGFDRWYLHYPMLCTDPANYQMSFDGDIDFRGRDGYPVGSWSFPKFDSIFIDAEPPPPRFIDPPCIPSIPDRSKKPVFTKANNGNGQMDVGEYVELQFPERGSSNYGDENSIAGEGTQEVFDKTVSKHIDMRDALASIGQKFSRLNSDQDENALDSSKLPNDDSLAARCNELVKKVEEKEAEIQRLQDLQRLRKMKPVSTIGDQQMEEAQTKITSLENEVDSLTRQLQAKERQCTDAEAQARLTTVERLRQERKMREKAVNDIEPMDDDTEQPKMGIRGGARPDVEPNSPNEEGSLRRSQSSPDVNNAPVQPMFQQPVYNNPSKSTVPVPDRSTKPAASRGFDPVEMERAELEFYTNNVRRIQGPEGRVAPGLTGLKNLGNTCYMNSTVQCLSNVPAFTSFFLSGMYRRSINYFNTLGSKGEVARNFAVLIGGLWEGRLKYIIPTQFKQCISKVVPAFAGYEQHDAQEFLLLMLDGLHEDLNLVKERQPMPEQNNDGLKDEEAAHRAWINHERINSSVVVNLFQGQLLSVLRCRTCQRESRTFDVFQYLSLPIPSDRKCKLEDCMQKFLEPEEITGDSKWFCPHCKRKRDVVKKISIWKLPKILLIHLKRFSFTGRWHEKLQTNVDFPTNRLDMGEYTRLRGSTYTLLGITNHYGTMEAGHYTAYCKNSHDCRWYKYDDHEVSTISQGNIKSPAAYILYYAAEDYLGELRR